jgi:hypothetical protein
VLNPLVDSFSRLESAVRDNPREGLFPELSADRSRVVDLPAEEDISVTGISVSELVTDKYKALAMLNKWKVSARINKKKDAEKDCDFIIRFINQVCP